jgi:hypothetical protein
MNGVRAALVSEWFSNLVISTWLISAAIITILLRRLDSLVHGGLYDYGLQFSPDWAVPYWASTSFIFISIAVTSTFGVAALAVGIRDLAIHRNTAPSAKTRSNSGWFSYTVIILWLVCGILISLSLNRIDLIVHGELYDYGLQFNQAWAVPYWTLVRFIYVFIAIPTTISIFTLSLTLWTTVSRRNTRFRANGQNSTNGKLPRSLDSEKEALTSSRARCPKCGRQFSRALVMMDYSAKPAQVIAICPYCNARLSQIAGKDQMSPETKFDKDTVAELNSQHG